MFKNSLFLLLSIIETNHAFGPSSSSYLKSSSLLTSSPSSPSRSSSTFLQMTPPLRPGQKADTTPFDSSEYFKSRGMDIDPKKNQNPLDVAVNVGLRYHYYYNTIYIYLLTYTVSMF